MHIHVCLCVLVYTFVQAQAVIQPQVRNVLRDKTKLWGDAIMVYQFSSSIIADASQVSVIEQSMREVESDVSTDSGNCITFKRKDRADIHRHDFVYITLADDGWCRTDNVGKFGKRQTLYLTNDCMYKREIKSLLLVTLGLYHEHQRPDRDQYIDVHLDNVQDVARPSFEKIPASETDLTGFPYDYYSITHFGPYAYANDPRRPTISTQVPDVNFENSSALSFYDVLKIQKLYGCAEGYTMFGGDNVNIFQQMSPDTYYPQWRDTSQSLPLYMTTDCKKNNSSDEYTLTVLNGATWTSELPLPPGNFCITVDICIGSSSPHIKSYIQLKKGPDYHTLIYTQPSGHWQTLRIGHISNDNWNVVLIGHILWGGDVLALDNLIVRHDVSCGM